MSNTNSILIFTIASAAFLTSCSEGGNTTEFNGQTPGTEQVNSTGLDFGPAPEFEPEIIPDNLIPPPDQNELGNDIISSEETLVVPVSLYVTPASIIDPITSVSQIESNTENLVIEYKALLTGYLAQVNTVHDLISAGVSTSDDDDIVRYDVDMYNQLLKCNPSLNESNSIVSFYCGETTVTLNYRDTEYPDVLITLDAMDLNQKNYGNTFATIIQNNDQTTDFSISIQNISEEGQGTIIATRSPEDFTCELQHEPFGISELNINACNATLTRSREVIKRLLRY